MNRMSIATTMVNPPSPMNAAFPGLNMPVLAFSWLFVRHSIDLDLGKSIKEIVDGQQRCSVRSQSRHRDVLYLNKFLNAVF